MSEMNEQMSEVIEVFEKLSPLPTETLSPEMARQQPEVRDAVMGILNQHIIKRAMPGAIVPPVESVEHRLIQSGDSVILLRIYTPFGEGPFPVLLYFHGGGFVIANLNTYDSSCRVLCDAASCIVVSVAYRQAPEHPYPAAADDAFAAYEWLLSNTASIHGDENRIAVAGESAGGNLAAGVCLRAKAEGRPMPIHQLLIYPLTQFDMETPSYREYADAKPLNVPMMKWFKQNYLQDGAHASDVYASPLNAADFSGLPPATILNAQIDPLLDDGALYAQRLEDAGVPVFRKVYDGVSHEFFGMAAVLDEAKVAVKDAARSLREAFESESWPGFGGHSSVDVTKPVHV